MDISLPHFLANGDNAVSVVFGDRISEKINQKIRAFQLLLTTRHILRFIETVSTYYTLMTHYDPCLLSYEKLPQKLHAPTSEINLTALPSNGVLEISVLYGGEMGLDLAHVAKHAGVSEAEVIKLYSEPECLTYILGFTPSFTHLGGLNPKLETPRSETPRVLTPASSVGIVGKQIGTYSIISPNGWQLIGKASVRMRGPDREVPIPPRAGQYIHLPPIAEEEYRKIEAGIGTGTYRLSIRKQEEAKA